MPPTYPQLWYQIVQDFPMPGLTSLLINSYKEVLHASKATKQARNAIQRKFGFDSVQSFAHVC